MWVGAGQRNENLHTATGVGAPAGLRPCTRAPQLAFAAAAKGGRVGKRGRINSFAINSSSRERSRGTSKAVPQRLFATTLRHIDFERKSRRQTKDYKESSTPTKVLRKDAGGVLESSTPLVVAGQFGVIRPASEATVGLLPRSRRHRAPSARQVVAVGFRRDRILRAVRL